jgi:hypothetical protein
MLANSTTILYPFSGMPKALGAFIYAIVPGNDGVVSI